MAAPVNNTSASTSTSDIQSLLSQQAAMYAESEKVQLQSAMMQAKHDEAMAVIRAIAQ